MDVDPALVVGINKSANSAGGRSLANESITDGHRWVDYVVEANRDYVRLATEGDPSRSTTLSRTSLSSEIEKSHARGYFYGQRNWRDSKAVEVLRLRLLEEARDEYFRVRGDDLGYL